VPIVQRTLQGASAGFEASLAKRPIFWSFMRLNWKKKLRQAAISVCGFVLVFEMVALVPAAAQDAQAVGGATLSQASLRQIAAVQSEKNSRTPAQQKMDSHLIYGVRESGGTFAVESVPKLRSHVTSDARGRLKVDIRATVNAALLQQIQSDGGQIIYSLPRENTIRALLPPNAIESIAARSDVRFIERARQPLHARRIAPNASLQKTIRTVGSSSTAKNVRENNAFSAASKVSSAPSASAPSAKTKTFQVQTTIARQIQQGFALSSTGSVDPEGDIAHRAAQARQMYGIDGSGVRVGVLSDGMNSLTTAQQSGALPANVTIAPGQAGSGDEGTAMLEIVHALAPGAQLYFATGNDGDANMAQNIRTLRGLGCDIIIDDLTYLNESPFQAGLIEKAVYDVSASGALYFSAAGNSGNLDSGYSGTWQGDFADGGAATSLTGLGGRLHNFSAGSSVVPYETANDTYAYGVDLLWNDPLGASSNDYDLVELDASGNVVETSTNTQNGSQDPYESLASTGGRSDRIVIIKHDGAANRYLYLTNNGGTFSVGTAGAVRGHSAADAANAFCVAAADAANGQPFVGGSANPVEPYSSDGPRHLFYNPDGTLITPGNLSSSGGRVLRKPDITAADDVSTGLRNFSPFAGTSAAAPHAGAIAALLLSYRRSLSPAQIRSVMQSTALDIMAPGFDRDSGYGIVSASAALASLTTSAPIASPDTFNVNKNAPATTLRVLDNDRDPNNYALSIVSVTQAQHGTVSLSNGQIFYRPAANYSGQDTFTYTISNGHGGSATATVTINVIANVTTPVRLVANPQSVSTNINKPVTITLAASVSNSSTNLSYIIVSAPRYGTLSGSGAVRTYTPRQGFRGNDAFTFKVSDGQNTSNIAKVTILVSGVARR